MARTLKILAAAGVAILLTTSSGGAAMRHAASFCAPPLGGWCKKFTCCECVATSRAGCCTRLRVINRGLCQ